MELIKLILEILKKNPAFIIELIKFILDLLEKRRTRTEIINSTVAKYDLPYNKVAEVVDLIIKNKNKAKFLF